MTDSSSGNGSGGAGSGSGAPIAPTTTTTTTTTTTASKSSTADKIKVYMKKVRDIGKTIATAVATNDEVQATIAVNIAADKMIERVLMRRSSQLAARAAAPMLLYDLASASVDIFWDPLHIKSQLYKKNVDDMNNRVEAELQSVVSEINSESPSDAQVSLPFLAGPPVPVVPDETLFATAKDIAQREHNYDIRGTWLDLLTQRDFSTGATQLKNLLDTDPRTLTDPPIVDVGSSVTSAPSSSMWATAGPVLIIGAIVAVIAF